MESGSVRITTVLANRRVHQHLAGCCQIQVRLWSDSESCTDILTRLTTCSLQARGDVTPAHEAIDMLRELKRRAAGDSLLGSVDGFAGDLASLGPVRAHVSGSVLTSGRVSIHITLMLAVSERLRGVEG